MRMIKLGKTGKEISKMGLGTWSIGGGSAWGGDHDLQTVVDTICEAPKVGINLIDTAPGYNFGNSEKIVGMALKKMKREDVTIITKCGVTWDQEMKGSLEWVEASVRHLNWLVAENGFTCIKHFVIFNEPDGNWASTNGDFAFWKEMVGRFQAEMDKYPALKGQVDIAGPDAVIDYANPASEYDAEGWLKATVENVPEVGIYDMHAYPGQRYVRFFRPCRFHPGTGVLEAGGRPSFYQGIRLQHDGL